MGFFTQRYFLLTICLLQLLSIIQRQVFDFLGFLWIPILVNFFEIIFVIFGFFGAFQYRPKYIISYSIWHLFWLGWNIFLICLYLDIGTLNHLESKVLKLDPDSGSWWVNGPGCKGTLNTTSPVPIWENVTNCLIDYRYVEIFQAGLQCVLAFLGATTGFCLSRVFLEEDDSFNYVNGDGNHPQHITLQPMYVNNENYPLFPILKRPDSLTESSISLYTDNKLNLFNNTSTNKINKLVRSDQIRFLNPVYRTSSFDKLTIPQRRPKTNRPKSLCASSVDY